MLTHVCNLLRDMNPDNYKKKELQKRISNRNNFDIQIFCNHITSYSFIFIAHILDESKFDKFIWCLLNVYFYLPLISSLKEFKWYGQKIKCKIVFIISFTKSEWFILFLYSGNHFRLFLTHLFLGFCHNILTCICVWQWEQFLNTKVLFEYCII